MDLMRRNTAQFTIALCIVLQGAFLPTFRMSEKYGAIEDALAWVAFCRLIHFYEKYGNVRESLDGSTLTQRTEALKKLQVILASMQRTIFL